MFGTIITIAAAIAIFKLLAMPETPENIDITKIKKEAIKGNQKAQYKLALCYWRGHYVDKDEKLAVSFLTQSAERNYDKAQYALGVYWGNQKDAEGNISEERIEHALYWLKRAQSNENKEAKLTLEKMTEFTEADFDRN